MIFKTEQGKYLTEDEECIKWIKNELINWSGFVEVIIRKPQRTKKQNSMIHAFFKDFATELEALGIEYKIGNLAISWTPERAKEFFIIAYLDGKRTSKTTTDELAKAIDKCIRDMNMRGGQLSIKENINDMTVSEVKRMLTF